MYEYIQVYYIKKAAVKGPKMTKLWQHYWQSTVYCIYNKLPKFCWISVWSMGSMGSMSVYHCKTDGAGKSFPIYPFMWDILYPPQLENHTVVYPFMWDILYSNSMNFNLIHPLNTSYSSFKWWYPSTEFHIYFQCFHTPDFIYLVCILAYNRVKVITQGSFFSQQVY